MRTTLELDDRMLRAADVHLVELAARTGARLATFDAKLPAAPFPRPSQD